MALARMENSHFAFLEKPCHFSDRKQQEPGKTGNSKYRIPARRSKKAVKEKSENEVEKPIKGASSPKENETSGFSIVNPSPSQTFATLSTAGSLFAQPVLEENQTALQSSSAPLFSSSLSLQARQVLSLIFFHLSQFLLACSFFICSQQASLWIDCNLQYTRLLGEYYMSDSKAVADSLAIREPKVNHEDTDDENSNPESNMSFSNGKKAATPSGTASSASAMATPTDPPSVSPFGFLMTMPQPGTAGIPYFEGKNITEFLTRYDDMCEDYHVKTAEKIRRLPRYCEMLIGQTISSLEEFTDHKWEALVKALKKEYRAGDSIQQVNSRAFLEAYKSKERTSADDIRNYCRKFGSISKILAKAGKLDNYTRIQWFVQGLPEKLSEDLFYKKGIKFDADAEDDDFDEILKQALQHLDSERRFKEIRRVDKPTSDRFSAMTDQFDKKVVLDNHENITNALKAPVAPTSTIALSSASEKALTELTSKFDAMVLAMNLGMHNGQASLPLPQGAAGDSSGAVPALSHAREFDLCSFCEMTDRLAKEWHNRREKCPTFRELVDKGYIHQTERGLICVGKAGGWSNPIRMVKGETQMESVRRALLLAGKTWPVEVNSMRIGEVEGEELSSEDEWDPEVTTYEYEDPRVSAARTDEKKPATPAWKEPVDRILKRKVETQSKYAIPKAPRFGSWNVVPKEDAEIIREVTTPKPAEQPRHDVYTDFMKPDVADDDVAMGEAAPLKKVREQKQTVTFESKPADDQGKRIQAALQKTSHDQLMRTAQGEFNLDLIQARFLKTPVSNAGGLTNGNIIATLPMFRSVVRSVVKESTESEASVSQPTLAKTVKVGSIGVRDHRLRKAYMRATPKTKVQVNGGGKYRGLLDSGAEVNVMTHDIVKAESLPMRPYPDINLVSHSGDRRPFMGICEDVELSIGGVAGQHHIFVIDAADHQLVLGQPFLLQMRVELTYAGNDVRCVLHSEDGRRTAEFTVATDAGTKMKAVDELFPESRIESLN